MNRQAKRDPSKDLGVRLPQDIVEAEPFADVHVAREGAKQEFLPGYLKGVIRHTETVEHVVASKVKRKALLLTPADSASHWRKLKATKEDALKAHRPTIGLTAKEKRHAHLYAPPKKGLTYEQLLPLHALWTSYIDELWGTITLPGEAFLTKLIKADFHGAILDVYRSRSPCHVGIKGIVIQETKHTFRILTDKNKVLSVPKKHTAFRLAYKGHTLEILGDQFKYAPADRVARKFKYRPSIDL